MTHKYPLIAAGVAAALAGATAQAAAPSISQAAGATQTLVIAGSSAAKNAILSAVENDVCGSPANTLLVTSAGGTKNFFALSCNTTATISGITTGSLVTIYYRTEGGSVVGALPIATGYHPLRLDLSNGTCAGSGLTATCTVNGSTTTNGPSDSWTGAVVAAPVQLGITDVEPALLTGADYPNAYNKAVWGSATDAQMRTVSGTAVPMIQQVFGLAVNVQSGSGISAPINLSRQSAAAILAGNYSDWHKVPDAISGNPIAAASSKITLINRESGSGTRTSANTYFLGYQCSSTSAISGSTGQFSTTDELNTVNSTAGAIGYASIDQLQDPHNSTSFPNLVFATINGVAPSNKAAAAGQYDYWYEATMVPGTGVSGAAASLSSFLQGDIPKLATAPQEPDVNVIPNQAGNGKGTVPLTSNGASGTLQIFLNPFTRSGSSCNVPQETN